MGVGGVLEALKPGTIRCARIPNRVLVQDHLQEQRQLWLEQRPPPSLKCPQARRQPGLHILLRILVRYGTNV